MRVLVTGGLGFIGRAVARDLVSAGHRVDVLSRGGRGVGPPAGADLVEGDVRDRDRIAAVVADRRYDGICHLAGLIRGRDSIADPLSYYDVNLGGTVNLLAAAKAAGKVGQRPMRFVFASTSIVYGSRRTGALSEDLPPAPENPYGASKVAAEQLIGYHAATGEISAVTLRCFNVAGAVDGYADTDPTRIIPNVLRAVRGELPHVSVNGDGSAVREFTHVLDVASAFRLALEATGAAVSGAETPGAEAAGAEAPGAETAGAEAAGAETAGAETAGAEATGAGPAAVYNVGTGRGVSVRELIATAERVTGRRVPVEHLPPKPEPHTLVSDPRRLMADFGWAPTHSDLDEIIGSAWR